MIFLWFYLSGLSNRIMRKYLITGDWSQSIKGLTSSHGIGIWQLCLGFPRCGGSSRRNRKFPGVSLTLCCFVVYSTRRFVSSLVLCYFVLVFFSPFSIAITARGEKRADLSAFSYVCSICACLVFSVSSSSSCLERAAVVIVLRPPPTPPPSLDFSLTFF